MRVGVIYGGRSSEHEVSLASAAAIFANLDQKKYDSVPIYVRRNGTWSLPAHPPTELSAAAVVKAASTPPPSPAQGSPDDSTLVGTPPSRMHVHCAAHPGAHQLTTIRSDSSGRTMVDGVALDVIFPVIHGPNGEDGTLQGLLDLGNTPYVGAGVLASALAMDKAMSKVVFGAHGLPITPYVVVEMHAWQQDQRTVLDTIIRRLGSPLFVKPANLGSSVGITRVVDSDRVALEQAINRARQFDTKVIVEAAVNNAREIECAVLGNDEPLASLPGEILASGDFYDYDAKYVDAGSRTVVPADLSPTQVSEIQSLSVVAYRALGIAGMARVDFLLDRATRTLYLNEINTIPGFTAISMYAKMWEASGLPYSELLDQLIGLALERHDQRQHLLTSRG